MEDRIEKKRVREGDLKSILGWTVYHGNSAGGVKGGEIKIKREAEGRGLNPTPTPIIRENRDVPAFQTVLTLCIVFCNTRHRNCRGKGGNGAYRRRWGSDKGMITSETVSGACSQQPTVVLTSRTPCRIF